MNLSPTQSHELNNNKEIYRTISSLPIGWAALLLYKTHSFLAFTRHLSTL